VQRLRQLAGMGAPRALAIQGKALVSLMPAQGVYPPHETFHHPLRIQGADDPGIAVIDRDTVGKFPVLPQPGQVRVPELLDLFPQLRP